ncbi:unnamed protein product [Orchesella dallaii]|uniref:MYND-type domain-containing protein n=1 Tax=Orchesella dallaii TaxID=48710 RepID=A0ABP1RW80_9HEXA
MACKPGKDNALPSYCSDGNSWREFFTMMPANANCVDVDYLKAKASQGSQVAAGVLESLYACFRLFDFVEGKIEIDESEWMDLMKLAYDCFAQDYQVYHLPKQILEMKKQVVDKLFEKSHWSKGEDEMKLRFCYARFSSEVKDFATSSKDVRVSQRGIKLLKEGIEMYPDNVHFYILLVTFYNHLEDVKSALFYAEKGIKKFPNNVNLLFKKASILHEAKAKRVDITASFEEYLGKAPEDHGDVPEAYFRLVTCYANELGSWNGSEVVFRLYMLGKEAEKKLLPCYFPKGGRPLLSSQIERLVFGKEFHNFIEMMEPNKAQIVGVLQRKPHLDNTNRKELIISHRQFMNETNRLSEDFAQLLKHKAGIVPKLKQSVPETSQLLLKGICLKEVNLESDTLYEGCVINLTIIDEPGVKSGRIQVIVQDRHGDVTRLYIYNEKISKESLEKFGVGTRMVISNPLVEDAQVGVGLRNDEPKCIVFASSVPNMCRFCGEANAPQKCSQCKKAWYCSKECQQHDWKMLKHKLVCSKV